MLRSLSVPKFSVHHVVLCTKFFIVMVSIFQSIDIWSTLFRYFESISQTADIYIYRKFRTISTHQRFSSKRTEFLRSSIQNVSFITRYGIDISICLYMICRQCDRYISDDVSMYKISSAFVIDVKNIDFCTSMCMCISSGNASPPFAYSQFGSLPPRRQRAPISSSTITTLMCSGVALQWENHVYSLLAWRLRGAEISRSLSPNTFTSMSRFLGRAPQNSTGWIFRLKDTPRTHSLHFNSTAQRNWLQTFAES